MALRHSVRNSRAWLTLTLTLTLGLALTMPTQALVLRGVETVKEVCRLSSSDCSHARHASGVSTKLFTVLVTDEAQYARPGGSSLRQCGRSSGPSTQAAPYTRP